MNDQLRNYRIYARAPGHKGFKAMNMRRMVQVNRVSEATTYMARTRSEAVKLRTLCERMNADRPGWYFELREVKT